MQKVLTLYSTLILKYGIEARNTLTWIQFLTQKSCVFGLLGSYVYPDLYGDASLSTEASKLYLLLEGGHLVYLRLPNFVIWAPPQQRVFLVV